MSTMTMRISDRLLRFFDVRRWFRRSDETAQGGDVMAISAARGGRESAMARLEQGYEEVIEVMAAVKAHTHDQAERSEQLLEVVREVPQAVAQLRQMADTQKKMAALLQKQMTAQAEDRALLNVTLGHLSKAFEDERAALDAVAATLSDRKRTDSVLSDRLGSLGGTLGRLDETSQASTLMLRTLAERTKHADGQVKDLYDRGRRQMMLMAAASLFVALAAVGVAAFAVILAQRSFEAAPSSPPAVTAPAVAAEVEPGTPLLPPTEPTTESVPAVIEVPDTSATAEPQESAKTEAEPVSVDEPTADDVAAMVDPAGEAAVEPVVEQVPAVSEPVDSEAAQEVAPVEAGLSEDIVSETEEVPAE
ncbi:hypothetical protein [Mucisphaera sp.]|uniref:hypothetical protein n=1 Tax=Mucisphaera sp. TaxID=2913024 RepID=UPI003D0CC485